MATLTADERAALLTRVRQWLAQQRMPVTRQRAIIAEEVFGAAEHVSVEALRERLEARGERVGTATIYRTLELLERGGFVRGHQFGEGFRRFEPAGPSADHGHLLCDQCGRVVEFTNDQLSRLLPMIADEHRFQHHRHRVEVIGTCADCLRRTLGGWSR